MKITFQFTGKEVRNLKKEIDILTRMSNMNEQSSKKFFNDWRESSDVNLKLIKEKEILDNRVVKLFERLESSETENTELLEKYNKLKQQQTKQSLVHVGA